MKRTLCLFLISCVFMIGCAGGKWVDCKPVHASSKSPVRYEKIYKLNSIEKVNIGNPILAVIVYDYGIPNYSIDAISTLSLSLNFRWKLRTYTVDINSDDVHLINSIVEVDGSKYYIAKVYHQNEWGILISESGKALNSCVYNFYHSMLFYPEDSLPIPNNKIFRLTENGKKALMYELIYSGRNDVSLNFTYREYTGADIARPAFYQNVTYQAAAKHIQFKNFKINIIEASNDKIIFSISDDVGQI